MRGMYDVLYSEYSVTKADFSMMLAWGKILLISEDGNTEKAPWESLC